MDVNLFKVYSNNDETILDSTVVEQNLNNISKLLDENKKNLSALSDENKELTDNDINEINYIFNFNVVDLMPVDTFRGCVNSILFTSSDNTVLMPITVARNISQFVDNLALDTGTSYLSLSLQTPNSDTTMVSDDNLKALEYLKNRIDNSVKQLEDRNVSHKIVNNLFIFMTMFLIVLNQNENKTIATLPEDQQKSIFETGNICLNYVSVYLMLLNLFPAFVTFSGSNKVLTNIDLQTKYGSIFNNIFDILKNAIKIDSEEETSQGMDELIKVIDTFPLESSMVVDTAPAPVEAPPVADLGTGIVSTTPSKKRGMEDDERVTPSATNKVRTSYDTVGLKSSDKRGREDDEPTEPTEQNQIVSTTPSNKDGRVRPKRIRYEPFGLNNSNMVAGSCARINIRNPLLYIKFLFEWSHDFGPTTVRAPTYISGDYNYYPEFYAEKGIFRQIESGWTALIERSRETVNDASADDEVDRTIFNELTSAGKKHDEPTYISSIVDALMIYCKHMKEDFLYIPVVEFKFTTDDVGKTKAFFETVFKYFKDQRMFIKPEDTEKEVHLSVTSDNTPIDKLPDDKALGFYMQDMNIEHIAIALSTYRKSLYTSWDTVVKPSIDTVDKTSIDTVDKTSIDTVDKTSIDTVVTNIFNNFKIKTDPIISRSKDSKYEIKTPAKLIDPITTGGLASYPTNSPTQPKIISQSELNDNTIFQDTIKLATIYGINQLLNAWIDNTKVVNSYELSSLDLNITTKVDKITFNTNNSKSFKWCVGDSTVNVICGALVNVAKNMGTFTFEQSISDEPMFDALTETETYFGNEIETTKYPGCKLRWKRIYEITRIILFHPNFRPEIPKTIRTVLMIISYLKSCGDEYQRLTCEFVNYIMDLTPISAVATNGGMYNGDDEMNVATTVAPDDSVMGVDTAVADDGAMGATPAPDATEEEVLLANNEYLLQYLPINTKLPTKEERIELKSVLLGTVYLLSKDRILIGESIEKNTPVYTFLQSPHQAFYDDMELADDFYKSPVGIKDSNITRKNIGILSNRRKELSSPAEINYALEKEKNTDKIINLTQEILLKTTNIGLSEDQKKLIKDKYNIQVPIDQEPIDQELIMQKINEQKNKLELLTKLSLALTYYSVGNTNLSMKSIYEELINTEIFKAVSLTINSDLLEDIKLKNSCRVPRTIGALNTLINNTYDSPEVVDKLIESYEVANELFLQKIKTFKQILGGPAVVDELASLKIDSSVIIDSYNGYIEYVNTNKNKFSDDIMKMVDSYLQAEIRKSERGSRGSRVSYSDNTADQDRLDALMAQIEEATKGIREREEQAKMETEQAKMETEQAAETAAAQQEKKSSKGAIKKMLAFCKKIMNEITKDKDKAEKTIQKLTKSKQDLEIKLAGKTKVYGLATYQALVKSLSSRVANTFFPSGVKGGNLRKKKTRKNKRKIYITKRQRTNNKKSIRKNRKNNKKHITKHKW